MSSLLSRHNLSSATVAGYLRGYEAGMPIGPEDWASAESMGTPAGTLVCCLEKVQAMEPEDTGESYRLTDLCVVVGADSDRPIAVILNFERYDLNFLDQFMAHRAAEAKHQGRNFQYVFVEPSQPASDQILQ